VDEETAMTEVTSESPAAADDDLFDEEWLATDKKHHRLRTALVVLLLASCVFLAGALVQKHFGSSSSGSAATSAAGGSGLPSLPEGGGFPGGSFPTGGAGASGDATSSPGDSAGQSDTTAPAVVGTIKKISGSTWTVVDFGGNAHRVRVGDQTQVTHPLGSGDDDVIRVGADVSVVGETADSGLVTATAVTFR